MHKSYQPAAIAPPFGNYSHGVEIPPGARLLKISGQVGVMPDGQMAAGFAQQAEWAWKNIAAILSEANMSSANLVSYTTYLIDAGHVADYRAVRDRFIGEAKPASTLLIVAGLAAPDWLIEIEAVAAAA